jgi:tetratricopeptide (TPR) repeat protein
MPSGEAREPENQREEEDFDLSARNRDDARIRNELGGTVYGPALQARDIGDVHIHQPAPLPPSSHLPAPGQLPPPSQLTGRGRDLAAVDAARESRVIVLTGPPGVGKTALAVAWGHGVRGEFPDGVLFADLHGHAPDGPASTSDVLGRFLRALGVDPRQVPADLAELTGLYRSLVIDKQMLVVLDDALTAAQVSPLLPSCPDSVTVVTSRWRLGGLAARGARVIQLDRLDADAALELLTRTIGDNRAQAEPHAARELVDLCARLPLAVCVAGARLAARSRWSLTEMVAAMAHERERLAALTMEDDMVVHSVLDVSYRTLTAEPARMYRLMGLFPGTHFDSGVAAAAAAAPRAEARRLLGVLTDANLLDDAADGQYRFHDLTRLHAREMADRDETATVREEAIRRMLDWFLASAGSACRSVTPYRTDLVLDIRYPPAEPLRFANPGGALEWLDRELPNAMAAARLAATQRLWSVTWQLADAMWPVFLYRGRYAERLEFDRLGLDAARQGGDAVGEAKMLYTIGLAVMNLGQPDQAEAYIEQALTAWQRLGQHDRVAGSQRRLGFVAMVRRHPSDAIGWFTRALTAYRELSDARHVALTLTDLSDAFIETGRTREAIASLEEAGSLLAGSPDPHNQARVLTRLGRAHERAGQLEIAAGYLDRALRAMREIGSARGEAEALVSLGDLAIRAGRREEARSRYAEAQRVLVSLGSPEEAQIRERLARLDQPDQA